MLNITTQNINEFILILQQQNRSQKYVRVFESFLNQLLSNKVNEIQEFITFLQNSNYKVSTKLQFKKMLFTYLNKFELKNEIKQLKSISFPKKAPTLFKTYSYEELIQKTEILARDSMLEKYIKILIRFLFETGLRRQELYSIDVIDSRMYVTGNGDKVREVFYNPQTWDKLKDNKYFVNRKNKQLHLASKWIKENFKDSRGSLHSLRRSFATHLIKNNVNIKTVQNLMGHSKIETTYRYVFLSYDENRNIYNQLMKI
ncbi:tyrosine-type recombinase/integrase [Mycoplasma sp. 392]